MDIQESFELLLDWNRRLVIPDVRYVFPSYQSAVEAGMDKAALDEGITSFRIEKTFEITR